MSSDQIQYRYGLFEAAPHTASLMKQGRVVRVQEQPFQVLVALLERHGNLVTRGRERLWPGDTFVEFDKSLASRSRSFVPRWGMMRPIRGSSRRFLGAATVSSRR